MKKLCALSILLGSLTWAPSGDAEAKTPERTGQGQVKIGWLSKIFQKKRRPPVLPYERALRRNEVFRS